MRRRSELAELLGDAPRQSRRGPWRAGVMVVLAFGLGVGLLALAGWFIAASAVAGLAAASTFSFLYPSAGVQALAMARTLARYHERIDTHEVTLALVGSLRAATFARAVALPRDRATELRSSELLGRVTTDADAVDNVLLRRAFPRLAAAAAVVVAVSVDAVLSAPLALIGAAGLLAGAGALLLGARRQVGAPATAFVTARAHARGELIETVEGLPELRSFGALDRAAAEVQRRLAVHAAAQRRLNAIAAAGQSAGGLIGDLALLGVAAAAAGLLGGPALAAPLFVLACLVAIGAFEPIVGLPGTVVAGASARAAAARLRELFGAARAPDTGTPAPLPTHWSVLAQLRGAAEIRAHPGDTVVISGQSGAGKSTLLRAIAGEANPLARVSIAGVDPARLDHRRLVEHVTLVAQDAQVFDGTVGENLRLAAPAADDSRLLQALDAVALGPTSRGLPAGLDTPTGPAGASLSGGQRRRLSVAQGLLRQPDVLLLDEPTEGSDPGTASAVLAGVRAFLPEATLIIALHDRQGDGLPWEPTLRVDVTAPSGGAGAGPVG